MPAKKASDKIPIFTKPQLEDYGANQKKRLLLWLAVGLFAAAIMVLWGWNLAVLWRDAQNQNSPEQNLWQEAKTGISDLNK